MAKRESKQSISFVKWMGPVLDALRDLGGSGKSSEVVDWIAEKFKISDDTRDERQKNDIRKFDNRVHWARMYLVWEGLLESSKRGIWALTAMGDRTHLSDSEARVIVSKWVRIHSKTRKGDSDSPSEIRIDQIKAETIAEESVSLDERYKNELLQILKNLSPSGFEKICQRLLREHGFQKVTVTGGPRDQGIDGIGILQVNPFVSFKVLFQCKKYAGTVSRAQVAEFRNAMIGRADKGIVMTTGNFSAEAIREANRDGAPPVELVDGQKLVEMFKQVELGLQPKTVFEVDNAFFAQFLEEVKPDRAR